MSGIVDILFSSDTIGCFEGSENMYLAEFIQLLYNVIGNGITQTKFTETILKNITRNEDLIDYSDSSYKNFFHGKRSFMVVLELLLMIIPVNLKYEYPLL